MTDVELYRLEAGQRRLYLDVADEIANALGCFVGDFLPHDGRRPSWRLQDATAVIKPALRGKPRPLKGKTIPQLKRLLRGADHRTITTIGLEILARMCDMSELF